MKFTIKNDVVALYNESPVPSFPKYTSQIVNLANQNAQGTRPAVVGQMSELFPAFLASGEAVTVENWREWYKEQYPDALEEAGKKIWKQVKNLRDAMEHIDRDMVDQWVEDLVIAKTFHGMYVQKAILKELAKRQDLDDDWRMASREEEAQGIDGYVGGRAYSVKPDTYRIMDRLPETIPVTMIYYTKTKTGLKVEVEE